SVANVPLFLVYLLVAFALLWLFKAAYLRVTPYPEIELIRQGNTAAAVSLGGSMLGFSMALGWVIAHSVGLVDLLLWGVIALGVQVAAYRSLRLLIPDLDRCIEQGSLSHGVLLGALSLCAGVLNGACMTP
ncbi:MAG: DUF350 domain-containing protein, partial [Candidatus Competibacteraceae bacterium]|nr:DUF350 domain-containing protein [Candidatus Competibacteraceae bacterium]